MTSESRGNIKAGVRGGEYVVMAFVPPLPANELDVFDADAMHPFSDEHLDEKGAVRGLVFHKAVFAGGTVSWQEEAMAYLKEQSKMIDYRFDQRRLHVLGNTAMNQSHAMAPISIL